MFDDQKVFYSPGDLVIVRHDKLENRPVMLVDKKIERSFKDKDGNITRQFDGMRCIWFDANQVLQSGLFSTKDLKHV